MSYLAQVRCANSNSRRRQCHLLYERPKDFHRSVCGKHFSRVGKTRVTLLCENEILKELRLKGRPNRELREM